MTDRPRGAALQGSPCPPPPPASTTCCSWGCAPGGHATSPPAALPSMPSASSSASTLLPTSCASMPIKHPSCRGSSRPPPSGHGEWCRRCPPPRVPPTTAPHVPRDGLQPARLLLGSHPAHSPALWGWRHCWFQGVNAIHVPSLSSQGVWLQGHHPIQQLLPTQRPPAQHRPPLARLRQPWHPAAALLHRGHAAEAAPPGCQGEGLWGCVHPNGPGGVVEWVLFSGMGPPQVAADSLLLQRAAVPAQSPTRDLVELESWPKDSDGVAEDTKVSWGSSTPVLRGCQCVLSPLCPFHPPAHAVLQRWEAEHGELHRPRHG